MTITDNNPRNVDAEKIPSIFQWYVKKMKSKSEEKLNKQLALDGWLLAFSPLIYFVADIIFGDGLGGLFIMGLCACLIAYDVAIIKYIRKEQWIRHPVGLFVCGVLFSVGAGIYWLFVKKKHANGTTEQKKQYSLQAKVAVIVLGACLLISSILAFSVASESDYCATHRCVENTLEEPDSRSAYSEQRYIESHCSAVCMTYANNIDGMIQNTEREIRNQGPRFSKIARCTYGKTILDLFRQSQQVCPSVSDCLTSSQKAKLSQFFGDC